MKPQTDKQNAMLVYPVEFHPDFQPNAVKQAKSHTLKS